MLVLSADPGAHRHGLAVWNNGVLVSAFYTKKDSPLEELQKKGFSGKIHKVVIEFMQIYRVTGTKQANDLLSVSFSSGCLVGLLGIDEIVLYKPREWKGQTPKNIMTKRIQKILAPEELNIVELPSAKSLQHNVWDGIGIGLKYWGRL